MTPMVRWIDPTGRIALTGSAASPESFGVVTSAAKRWMEDWSCGRDVGDTSGRQRKWVRWCCFGFGGMVRIGRMGEGLLYGWGKMHVCSGKESNATMQLKCVG